MDNKINSMQVQGQPVVLLPASSINDVLQAIEDLKAEVVQRLDTESASKWLESEDARKLLGVSPRTWQNLRDKRKLGFSQIGRKVYVRKSDLEAYMMSHYVAPQV